MRIIIFILTLLGVWDHVLTQSTQSRIFPIFSSNCEYRERDFILITKALSYGLNFFKENVDTLILDGAVGTRIVERQIQKIFSLNLKMSPKAALYLARLQETAEEISEQVATIYEKRDAWGDDGPTKDSLPWVTSDQLWKSPEIGHWRNLNLGKNWRNNLTFESFQSEVEVMNESISDNCIGHLFEDCVISPQCQKTFLSGAHSKYSLTHQVIYLHVAQQMTCVYDILKNWRVYLEKLCLRVYQEAKIIESEGFPKKFQDLFAEQVVVCGLAGYPEFMNPKWTYDILFWQKQVKSRTACFPEYNIGEEDVIVTNQSKGRQKRSDVVVGYENSNCSIHFSAVGIAALSLNLRYLVETCVFDAVRTDCQNHCPF